MNFEQLVKLSEKNDVRIDDHKNFKTSLPYYYDSLRHAFEFYFNTFITNNTGYRFYAEGLYKRNVGIFKHQVLDTDNTMLAIISFERFFELFLKSLLSKVDKRLATILIDNNQRIQIMSQDW